VYACGDAGRPAFPDWTAVAAYIEAKFTLDQTVQTPRTTITAEMMTFVVVLSRSKRSASIAPSMVFGAGTDFTIEAYHRTSA
jgi:hypothetical protein